MKLLTTTPLPARWNPPEHEQQAVQRSIADDNYIVVALSDATVHVLSSRTGALLQKRPFIHPVSWICEPILDGDNLIMACARDPNIITYNIPSE